MATRSPRLVYFTLAVEWRKTDEAPILYITRIFHMLTSQSFLQKLLSWIFD